MTTGFRSAGLALVWGAATASTVLICPAVAVAGPDQASDQQQCADEQDQQAQQACEAAEAAAAAANQAIGGAQKAADAAGQQASQAGQQAGDGAAKTGDAARNSGIDLSDKDCWVINGVPMMYPQYAATLRGPGDVVGWCPDVYHKTPH